MGIASLAELFEEGDWTALLDSGDITQDEFEAWSDASEDFAFEQNWEREVFQRASSLAAAANDGVDLARDLRRRVIDAGGISGSDYESIPAKYKRRDGYPMDEICAEVGFEDDAALFLAIQEAEEVLRGLPIVNGKRVAKFRVKDFLTEANNRIVQSRERKFETDEEVPF